MNVLMMVVMLARRLKEAVGVAVVAGVGANFGIDCRIDSDVAIADTDAEVEVEVGVDVAAGVDILFAKQSNTLITNPFLSMTYMQPSSLHDAHTLSCTLHTDVNFRCPSSEKNILCQRLMRRQTLQDDFFRERENSLKTARIINFTHVFSVIEQLAHQPTGLSSNTSTCRSTYLVSLTFWTIVAARMILSVFHRSVNLL